MIMRDDRWRVASKGNCLAVNGEKTECVSMSVHRRQDKMKTLRWAIRPVKVRQVANCGECVKN